MGRIVIFMDGGLIQDVVADEPTEVYVVDYDTEGVDEDHPYMTKFSGDDCILHPIEPNIDSLTTRTVHQTWKTA